MKNYIKIILGIGMLAILTSFQTTPFESTFSLTIKVNDLRNSKGVVQFALYNKDGSIPDQKYEFYYKIATSAIDNRSASHTFSNLPKGKYAINILHDENENGKIDKGMFLPKEGIGFSNYEKINLTHRPNFSNASFDFNKDTTKIIKIIYL